MPTREEWMAIDLRRFQNPTMWPQHPLPVKRYNGTGTGVLYVNDLTVYQHGGRKEPIQKYESVEALAKDWRPD